MKGQENSQEILSKQLYLCQCLVGLNVVRENGHLVIKLFDLLTPFSVGLIYLMYKCFHQICILKPNSRYELGYFMGFDNNSLGDRDRWSGVTKIEIPDLLHKVYWSFILFVCLLIMRMFCL